MANLSLRAYAKHRAQKFGKCTLRAVQKAIQTGRITTDADGKIDADAADKAWEENTSKAKQRGKRPSDTPVEAPVTQEEIERVAKAAEAGEIPPFHESEAVLEHYKAQKARLEYEQRKGDLLDAEEVKQKVCAMIATVRARLVTVGDELSMKLALESDAIKCRELVDGRIFQALEELAAYGQ